MACRQALYSLQRTLPIAKACRLAAVMGTHGLGTKTLLAWIGAGVEPGSCTINNNIVIIMYLSVA